jgi:hypothetical protein
MADNVDFALTRMSWKNNNSRIGRSTERFLRFRLNVPHLDGHKQGFEVHQ